jgi:hypothetical protein
MKIRVGLPGIQVKIKPTNPKPVLYGQQIIYKTQPTKASTLKHQFKTSIYKASWIRMV